MANEGLPEFQLSGKQLVFLFMASTVVAVVIFLCGVLVGRGRPVQDEFAVGVLSRGTVDPTAPLEELPVDVAKEGAPDLAYPEMLGGESTSSTLVPPREPAGEVVDRAETPSPVEASTPVVQARPRVQAAATAPPPASPPPASRAPSAAAQGGSTQELSEPPGNGFVVQVAAVRQRAEATRIARRLSVKGYPVFVTSAGPNFRVRVGKYTNRAEAESVAQKLEREERFKPWLTR